MVSKVNKKSTIDRSYSVDDVRTNNAKEHNDCDSEYSSEEYNGVGRTNDHNVDEKFKY